MRILGLDPSLSSTGWGIVEVENNRLRYVADGFIKRIRNCRYMTVWRLFTGR